MAKYEYLSANFFFKFKFLKVQASEEKKNELTKSKNEREMRSGGAHLYNFM
jgi:hypothetical protein